MHTIIDSPLGDLTLVADDDTGALSGLYFDKHRGRPDPDTFGPYAPSEFTQARQQLGEYFAGDRTEFTLPLAGGDDSLDGSFDQTVWDLLGKIPYGETRSYGDLARELGDVALAQAVGAANGRNPLCVIVPCHRVVGADGRLVGYAGGLARKRHLLDLEQSTTRLF
jgi:methylated-DNA-[protein]-cysteine S-methyltransferase